MDIVEVKKLKKIFEKKPVVAGISFTVKKGEILGLLGPNGAGKTTTIAMMLGITSPTSGEIFIFGQDIKKHRSEIMARMNYSSAYTKAPARMKVVEHLRVFGYLYEVPDVEKRITSLLKTFQLTEFRDALVGDLSSGNMARVNLCKSFINYPELILLDEPTSSLDPDVAGRVREYLLKVQEKYGTTVLITSHNMAEIEEICDRVIFINHGKIIAVDTPEGLAKKIDVTRIQLLMKDGQKRTLEYCKNNNYKATASERMVTIETHEKQVAQVLSDLAAKGVSYSQISIEKPTLEDYFLTEVRL